MRRPALACLLSLAASALAGVAAADDRPVASLPVAAAVLPPGAVPVEGPLPSSGAFAQGPVAVVAVGSAGLQEITLVPCGLGRTICRGPGGPQGRLVILAGHEVVQFPGLSYWLAPGGGGEVETAGWRGPLAWNPIVQGTGIGTEAVMDQPVPHR